MQLEYCIGIFIEIFHRIIVVTFRRNIIGKRIFHKNVIGKGIFYRNVKGIFHKNIIGKGIFLHYFYSNKIFLLENI